MTTKEGEKTKNLIKAVLDITERDVGLGFITPEEIAAIPKTRYAIADRRKIVEIMKAEGKSQREIAKELGVSQALVSKDLVINNELKIDQKVIKTDQKVITSKPPASPPTPKKIWPAPEWEPPKPSTTPMRFLEADVIAAISSLDELKIEKQDPTSETLARLRAACENIIKRIEAHQSAERKVTWLR
jgi:Trp operon repressor